MLTIDKLDLIFPDFPVPALILTPDDGVEIIKANRAYLDLFGLSSDELCGRPLFEVFPDDEVENPESVVKRSNRTIREVVSTKEPKTPGAIAYPLTDFSGSPTLRFFMPEFVPVVDESGEVSYIFHFTHEVKGQVAERPPLKHPIIASFESILETAHNAFLLTTGDGQVLLANKAACTLFGYSKEEFGNAKRHELLDYNDERLHALLLERATTGAAKGEITGIRRNGQRFPCEYSTSQFVDATGEKRCCTEIVDLSKWKEEEARISRSESNLKTIFNSTPDGFLLMDKNLKILACNNKANEFIHLNSNDETPDFQIGSSILAYIEPDRLADFEGIIRQVLKGEVITYTRSYQNSNGSNYWYDFSINPVWEGEAVTGLCISGRDITAQKQAEQEVINNEQLFRRLVENNTDAIAILNADFKVMYVSPAGEHITGYTEEEARQLESYGTIHEEDIPAATRIMAEVMASPGIPIKASPLRMQHKDGSWRWVEATITNMLHDPAIGGIIDNFWDVTERIRSARRLLDARHAAELSEINYRNIFNQSPLPKWIYDLETLDILEVNEAAVRHYGYSREEFLSMTILEIRPEEDRLGVKKMVRDIHESTPTTVNYWRHLKKGGEIISVDIYSHPIEFNDRNARMVVCRDVTERLAYLQAVEAQNKQLREIAWFQSHMVRAPLARIIGLTNLLTIEPTKENLKEIVPMLIKSANEMDEVVHDIVEKTNIIYGDLPER